MAPRSPHKGWEGPSEERFLGLKVPRGREKPALCRAVRACSRRAPLSSLQEGRMALQKRSERDPLNSTGKETN